MQYEWTFHCFEDGNYWECILTDGAGKQTRCLSQMYFVTRAGALYDAKSRGLKVDDPNHSVLYRKYGSDYRGASRPGRPSDHESLALPHR
jgi:hypothetical protein